MTAFSPAEVARLRAKAARTALEDRLARDITLAGLPEPVREHAFAAPARRWRFDFAWLDLMLAVEVDGGTHSGGRHVRAGGYERDCDKLNEAACRGWHVLRFTGAQVRSGVAVATIERVIVAWPEGPWSRQSLARRPEEAPSERRAPATYEPRHDPDFADAVVGYLMCHIGEWVRLDLVFSADPWVVRDAVVAARRVGLCILGDHPGHGSRGYKMEPLFQGHRYVHLRKALAWPPDDSG